MEKDTVTISLDSYKRMEEKIKNLETAITDIKANKECVSWNERGMFPYSYWFYNPSETTQKIIKEMNELSEENDKLRDELKKKDPYRFFKFFGL